MKRNTCKYHGDTCKSSYSQMPTTLKYSRKASAYTRSMRGSLSSTTLRSSWVGTRSMLDTVPFVVFGRPDTVRAPSSSSTSPPSAGRLWGFRSLRNGLSSSPPLRPAFRTTYWWLPSLGQIVGNSEVDVRNDARVYSFIRGGGDTRFGVISCYPFSVVLSGFFLSSVLSPFTQYVYAHRFSSGTFSLPRVPTQTARPSSSAFFTGCHTEASKPLPKLPLLR